MSEMLLYNKASDAGDTACHVGSAAHWPMHLQLQLQLLPLNMRENGESRRLMLRSSTFEKLNRGSATTKLPARLRLAVCTSKERHSTTSIYVNLPQVS